MKHEWMLCEGGGCHVRRSGVFWRDGLLGGHWPSINASWLTGHLTDYLTSGCIVSTLMLMLPHRYGDVTAINCDTDISMSLIFWNSCVLENWVSFCYHYCYVFYTAVLILYCCIVNSSWWIPYSWYSLSATSVEQGWVLALKCTWVCVVSVNALFLIWLFLKKAQCWWCCEFTLWPGDANMGRNDKRSVAGRAACGSEVKRWRAGVIQQGSNTTSCTDQTDSGWWVTWECQHSAPGTRSHNAVCTATHRRAGSCRSRLRIQLVTHLHG